MSTSIQYRLFYVKCLLILKEAFKAESITSQSKSNEKSLVSDMKN